MDFRLPELGEGVYEAELLNWLVKIGDSIKHGQNLMEVMTDKATMEVPSPVAGKITALLAEPGQVVKVGDHVMSYTKDADKPANDLPQPLYEHASGIGKQPGNNTGLLRTSDEPGKPVNRAASGAGFPVKAAPSVRYMARKLGIDLSTVQGSGPGGRILLDDLSAAVARTQNLSKASTTPAADYGTPGTRIKFQGLRRKIAEHMVKSKTTIPHYSYVDECDVTELVTLRQDLRERFEKAGLRLTYLPFFVKAAVAALKEVPIVNAMLDEDSNEIILHDRYDVGVATATPAGLVVPVVREADRKSLDEIASEIERLGNEAKAGKSRREDLSGSTFTISSIGNIGGLFSTPVINYPELGILGIGKITRRPVYDRAGNMQAADMVYLSFSFDHRILDGAVGAAFGNAVIRQLQHPASLLLPIEIH